MCFLREELKRYIVVAEIRELFRRDVQRQRCSATWELTTMCSTDEKKRKVERKCR